MGAGDVAQILAALDSVNQSIQAIDGRVRAIEATDKGQRGEGVARESLGEKMRRDRARAERRSQERMLEAFGSAADPSYESDFPSSQRRKGRTKRRPKGKALRSSGSSGSASRAGPPTTPKHVPTKRSRGRTKTKARTPKVGMHRSFSTTSTASTSSTTGGVLRPALNPTRASKKRRERREENEREFRMAEAAMKKTTGYKAFSFHDVEVRTAAHFVNRVLLQHQSVYNWVEAFDWLLSRNQYEARVHARAMDLLLSEFGSAGLRSNLCEFLATRLQGLTLVNSKDNFEVAEEALNRLGGDVVKPELVTGTLKTINLKKKRLEKAE